MNRFNQWLALKITDGVATMWCAYLFAVLALIGLPSAIQQAEQQHSPLPLVAWLAQTFLQLVLLSIILVGQKLQADTTIKHINNKHDEHMGELTKIREHLHRLKQ